jgi:hypothetical protein
MLENEKRQGTVCVGSVERILKEPQNKYVYY